MLLCTNVPLDVITKSFLTENKKKEYVKFHVCESFLNLHGFFSDKEENSHLHSNFPVI